MTSKRNKRVRTGAGGADVALPALSSLADLPAFASLSATSEQVAAFDTAADTLSERDGVARDEFSMGCVVRLDRGFPAVVCADALMRAEHAHELAKRAETRPAVGDWVVVRRTPGHDMAVIEQVLPRTSDIARWRGGSRGERQTLAANVDVVLVAQALTERPVMCDRIARSVVIALDCGAVPAIVLTKADRCASPDRLVVDVSRVRAVAGPGVAVAVTASGAHASGDGLGVAARSAGAAWGDDSVLDLVPTGTIAIVLGESGAGKSTLLNALLGHESLETGSVRARDDAGRHTTVTRRMVSLPGAGVIVDEPGLRSLPLVGHERGLAKAFPEIADAARGCRFRDCTHTSEPGCGVILGFEAGEIDGERLAAYRALAAEMRANGETLDPDVVL